MAIAKFVQGLGKKFFYDYNKFENLIATSETEYLHITSSE